MPSNPTPVNPAALPLPSLPAARPFVIASGNWFFKVRDVLSPIVFAALILCTRPLWPSGDAQATALIVVGAVLASLGQLLRAAVIGYAYVKRGGKDKKVYAATLITAGFFNHTRNPMYVGNVLILLGLLIVWGAPIAFAVGGTFYLCLYWAITRAEERYLGEKFGDAYAAYAARVNRYLPDLRGLRGSLIDMRYDWRRLVRKEYGTFCVTFATFILILSRKAYLDRPIVDTITQRTLGLLLLTGAIAWAAARVLKKRGLLGEG